MAWGTHAPPGGRPRSPTTPLSVHAGEPADACALGAFYDAVKKSG